jgi:hypothetical protein
METIVVIIIALLLFVFVRGDDSPGEILRKNYARFWLDTICPLRHRACGDYKADGALSPASARCERPNVVRSIAAAARTRHRSFDGRQSQQRARLETIYARHAAFQFGGCLFTYAILRLQYFLPLNPQKLAGVSPIFLSTRPSVCHQYQLAELRRRIHLRVYVTHLRQKIEADPIKPAPIKTEPGIGYRFTSFA